MDKSSEFEIPAAILAASVVGKSDLTGDELAAYAIRIHRMYVRQMITSSEKEKAERK